MVNMNDHHKILSFMNEEVPFLSLSKILIMKEIYLLVYLCTYLRIY